MGGIEAKIAYSRSSLMLTTHLVVDTMSQLQYFFDIHYRQNLSFYYYLFTVSTAKSLLTPSGRNTRKFGFSDSLR